MGYWTEQIHTCAKEQFGYTSLLPVQQLVIHNILEAIHPPPVNSHTDSSVYDDNTTQEYRDHYNHQLIILPTGTGKSACFQIPASLIKGLTIIVYPLLSLINDQLRRFNELHIPSLKLIGGMSEKEIQVLKKALAQHKCKCILTNPETLSNPQHRTLLKTYHPKLIVIDEAHCISKWGNTFRSSYLSVGDNVQELNAQTIVAFTATASHEVIADIKKFLFLNQEMYLLHGHTNRENITYSVLRCFDKNHALVSLLSSSNNTDHTLYTSPSHSTSDSAELPLGTYPVHKDFSAVQTPAIVFCSSRADCEKITLMLRDFLTHNQIYFYHAGLNKQEKDTIEHWFFHSEEGILVATCAYGMGVDKANIRTVIHYEPYSDIENFLQETGRAGRDQKPSASIMLAEIHPQNIIEEHTIACRREYFMQALQISYEGCTGCDICLQQAPIISWEYHYLVHIASRFPRCFDATQLCEYATSHYMKYHPNTCTPRYEIYCCLSHAIQHLLKVNILIQGTFLWRHKIRVNHALVNKMNIPPLSR